MASYTLKGKTVSVLDAHGILYQVFYSMGDMATPRGEPTGATFGFVRDLITLLTKVQTDCFFCAFDLPGVTFRRELAPDYKANRSQMPDDLQPQIQFVRDFLPAFGIEPLGLTGYEADDILATVAAQTEAGGGECILVTSDKDARQLISEHVSLYSLRKQQYYRAAELLADWGITPEQVVDFQTMVGDATDNVHGIPLIGPKTATDLLVRFGSLNGILENLDQITGKKKANIAAAGETIALARQLVQLKRDVPIDIPWEKGFLNGIDPDRLTDLCKYFGFRSLLPKVNELVKKFGVITTDAPVPDYLLRQKQGNLFDLGGLVDRPVEKPPRQPSLLDFVEQTEQSTAISDTEPLSSALPETQSEGESGSLITEPSKPLPVQSTGLVGLLENIAPTIPISPYDELRLQWELVDHDEKFESFLSLLKQQQIFSIDLETTDIRPRFAKVVGIAIAFEPDRAWYLPVRGPLGSDLLDESVVLERLKPILESESIAKVGQNIKYDIIVLRNAGIRLRGLVFDTMVADYLLRTGERNHNLDDMSDFYLQHETVKIEELIGKGKNQKSMAVVPTSLVAHYAGEDALVTWLLFPILLKQLQGDQKLLHLFADLEIPLVETLVEMEYEGIDIQPDHFRVLSKKFQERLDVLAGQIRDMVREVDPDPGFADSFNLNSPLQLQRILFDDLKLPVIKKTQTGRSTDIDVLEELAGIHPLPEKIIEHRQITKLLGTYIVPLPQLVHPETGRIHASFNQVVTATGRLSSSDPNLQNIPIRSEEGKLIRQGFIPDASLGYDTLVSCDYSQIELRMLAHFSKDAKMIAAFQADEDIHTHVATQIFDVPTEEVTSEMRRKAKAVNFGLVYGQSAFGLSKAINISRDEASAYIHSFFETYSGIQVLFDRILTDCHQNGYVKTLLGRIRRIEGVRAARRGSGQMILPERTAINTVIQGSAADLMKLAMINVFKRLYEKDRCAPEKARLLLQIHDELVFETSKEFAPVLVEAIRQEMELSQPLSVPLKIDAETGPNWGELE